MGRPPVHSDDRLDKLLSVRVTHDVYAYIEELAARAGISVSRWVSDAIGEKMERTEGV